MTRKLIVKIINFFILLFLVSCTAPKPKEEVREVVVIQPDYKGYYSLSHLKEDKKEEAKIKSVAIDLVKGKCSNLKNDHCSYIFKSKKENKIKLPSFSFQNLNKYENASYDQIYRSLKMIKDEAIIKNIDKFTKKCQLPLQLALSRKLENDLPTNFETVLKIYNELIKCSVSDELEPQYLRIVLISHLMGKEDLTKILLNNLLNKEQIVEKARIYFWAGEILKDKSYFIKLIKERPYSFQAVLASDKLGIDLWQEVMKKNIYQESRIEDPIILLYEKLLFYKQYEAAFELINDNLKNDLFKTNPGLVIYALKLMDYNGRVDHLVRLVSKTSLLYPERFNEQLIRLAYKQKYLNIFESQAPDTDPFLLLALSKQESAFNEKAKSRAKAQGLMQLLPSTARILSKQKSKNLYDIDNNIFLGSTYFRQMVQRFNSVELALAAYNAGPLKVQEWQENYLTKDLVLFLDLIPFKETRLYVSSILRNNYFYHQFYENKQINQSIKSVLVDKMLEK